MKVNSLDASASCRQDKQLISVLDESNKNTEFLANTAAAWKWDKKILNIWSQHLLFCFLRQAPFTLDLNAVIVWYDGLTLACYRMLIFKEVSAKKKKKKLQELMQFLFIRSGPRDGEHTHC